MAFRILRVVTRNSIGFGERFTLLTSTSITGPNKFAFYENVDANVRHASTNKSSSSIFEQARQMSGSHKKNKKHYQSESESDSDSDKENRKKKTAYTSDFWRLKMRTLHGIFDVNNDGVISFDDFEYLSKKFGDLGHLSEQEKNEFADILRSTWEMNWGEPTPYNLVTVEQYLADMFHVMTDKDLKKKVHKFLPYLFQAVDKDNSGEISIEEFKLFFNCLGLTDRDATMSFAAIDKNNDGVLSIKEFVKLGRDFFLTENPKRVSKHFWGPLVANH